ncbi:MAG: class I SAM-dependent methyltransferase [Terriglobia bacterium]
MPSKHKTLVQKQFTKTCDAFSQFAVRDSADVVAERVVFANPQADDIALDVACGPGAIVLALAPRVRLGRGIDLTHAMLVRAARLQAELQIVNAAFDEGDAEQLPYPDHSFTLVSCQFAFHHMPRPSAVLREMLRVARPEARLLLVDSISPESDEKGELFNRIEIIRDPSHTSTLRWTDFLKLFESLHLEIVRQGLKRRARSFNDWMLRAGLEPSALRYAEARRLIESSAVGDGAGFSPQIEGGELTIFHHEGMFLLRRRVEAGLTAEKGPGRDDGAGGG